MQKSESYGTATVPGPLVFETNTSYKTFNNGRFVKGAVSDMGPYRIYPRPLHTQSTGRVQDKYANRLCSTSVYLPSSANMTGDMRRAIWGISDVVG